MILLLNCGTRLSPSRQTSQHIFKKKSLMARQGLQLHYYQKFPYIKFDIIDSWNVLVSSKQKNNL